MTDNRHFIATITGINEKGRQYTFRVNGYYATDADFDTAIAYYTEQLRKNGWMVSYVKADHNAVLLDDGSVQTKWGVMGIDGEAYKPLVAQITKETRDEAVAEGYRSAFYRFSYRPSKRQYAVCSDVERWTKFASVYPVHYDGAYTVQC